MVSVTWLVFTTVGCEFLGPRAVRAGRTEYNAAAKTTDVEQLLLNIVRLRFNDKPYFLEISSISATTEGTAAIGGNQDIGVEGGLRYLERPTIIYQPLTGESFVRQLLTPIDLKTLLLLRDAGWEMDNILRVFADSINGIPNAPTAADSSPEGVPDFEEFLAVVEAFDQLEDIGAFVFAARQQKEEQEMVIRFRPKAAEAYEFTEEFAELLNLELSPDSVYTVRIGLQQETRTEIVIRTRPLLSAMFYLGQSIDIPAEIVEAGGINISLDERGQLFDWRRLFDGLIHIRSADSRPPDAYAAVPYGPYWFYIDNADADSKETLTLVSTVLTLKAGGVPSEAPLLTLPVTGG
jgi:hypothetical protein